ncbi:protease HtpX [Haliea sp.]|jgi:heat shock protein HtpX|nr:protease HtpX [Haliea sp.]HBM83430.1 protease HtpX [Halieaceae bacterium]MAD65126.1 protease HtpX [Haliea sp.]MAY92887.1 protease HtpX [Haliea sp.]MBK40374.1 protease HtpX [Haliea sp.]MBP68909.1 protease HtpX [Haliea sp.]|tara:strand:+ start:28729 stop:29610 length:882 start_codon:yes stop_codon:yes gene_type:complete
MRILLFLATNIAVLVLVSIIFNLLGLEGILAANGVDLNLGPLLIFCALFGFGGSLISLFLSKWLAKRGTGTYIIEQPRNRDEQWLLDTVRELAEEAGIGMPEVGVFPSEAANAFATGWNRNAALVAVSSGMLQRFQPAEVRAVMAHEIGHVANGDMVTLTLIQGVVNTFVMFLARIIGHTVDRVIFKTERGYGIGYYVVTIVAELVLGFLASMIVFWFSRWREYRADAAGARLAGGGAMVAALQRLRAEQGLPQDLPGELTAFGISEQMKEGFSALFRSHPPLEDRIRALQQD